MQRPPGLDVAVVLDVEGRTLTIDQAQLLLEAPLHVVSEVLGHASIAITKDVYGHLLEGDKRAAAESMSRALFGG